MKPTRLWEIDLTRGIAVLGMIIYHFIFDLKYFHLSLLVDTVYFRLLGFLTASAFIFLVGFSAQLRFLKLHTQTISKVFIQFSRRALTILFFGFLISFVTYLISPREFVIFGILHFIGLSLFLIFPFLYFDSFFILTAIIFLIILTPIFSSLHPTNLFLIWLGSSPQGFVSFDYVPLIPWFALFLSGLISARFYTSHRPALFKKFDLSNHHLAIFGRHSLLIYLIHQPIIFVSLYLFLVIIRK